MRKLLITGFDPFWGDAATSPSWTAAAALPDTIGDFALCKLHIPTVFTEAAQLVLDTAADFRPDVTLCTGLAGGRDAVTPERIAAIEAC